MVTIFLILFFSLIGVRLAPLYLEAYKVKAVLDSMATNDQIAGMKLRDIRQLLSKRFDVENIRKVSPDDVLVDQEDGFIIIEADYELRAPLMGNLDGVAKFYYAVEFEQN